MPVAGGSGGIGYSGGFDGSGTGTLVTGLIGTVPASIYLSSGSNAITSVIICNPAFPDPSNPTKDTVYLTLYAVRSGTSAINPQMTGMIVNNLPIPAGETVSFDQEKMVLSSGDQLSAVISAGDSTTLSPLGVTVSAFSAKTGSGPYLVTLTIPSTPALATNAGVGSTFVLVGNSNANYGGLFKCTGSSSTSITLSYPNDPGTYGSGTTKLYSFAAVSTVSTLPV